LEVDATVGLISYTNYVVLMSRALFGWKAPVVAGVYSTLGPSLPHQSHSWLRKFLNQKLFRKAEAVLVTSKGAKRDLVQAISLPRDRVHVIHNPVDLREIRALAQEPTEPVQGARFEVVAVGRLTAAKDYPTLLRAFQAVANKCDAHLTIVGEGEERSMLEGLSRELGLEDSVSFPGFVPNQYKYMARADLLALSSAWEGFPTVIEEAMACGTPVVATDCPSGPSEMITDGENGLLVPVGDEAKLAQAILRLLEDPDLRDRLAQAGTKRVDEFEAGKVTRQYEALVLKVTEGA
jgi:glycosyltransferase involved in cell wall biosynthesis